MYLKFKWLERFYDIVLISFLLLLFFESPIPDQPLVDVWNSRNYYLPYIISLLIFINFRIYLFMILDTVETINAKIICLNVISVFLFFVLPYFTHLIVDNSNSLVFQSLYGLNYMLINFVLVLTYNELQVNHKDDDYLKEPINIYAVVIPLISFILCFIVASLVYPIAISYSCLFTVLLSIFNPILGAIFYVLLRW